MTLAEHLAKMKYASGFDMPRDEALKLFRALELAIEQRDQMIEAFVVLEYPNDPDMAAKEWSINNDMGNQAILAILNGDGE